MCKERTRGFANQFDRVLLPQPVQQIADADEQEYAVDRQVLVKGCCEVVPLYEWEADGALVAQVEWGEEQDAEQPHPSHPRPRQHKGPARHPSHSENQRCQDYDSH